MRAPLALEMRAAAHAVERVVAGAALPPALAEAGARRGIDGRSRAAMHDIAYTAVRTLGLCRALARRLNAREPAPAVAALQVVALSALVSPGRRHEAVVVDQAVAAAREDAATRGAAPFLNATLRRFLREREALVAEVLRDPEARWNHPRWWIDQVRADHPRHWQAILEAANQPPPMTLRVNVRRVAVDDYLARLDASGIAARRIGPQALVLDAPRDVRELPGFEDGLVSVQDLAAQLAAPLLDVEPGQRVLDACAAPGGKTAHLLELTDCDLTAIDSDAARLARVHQNLDRLGLHARVLQGDASAPADWWDGRPFDRILVDAPCSASGIVRRHPEIRWLRRRGDLATLSGRQLAMLEALWPLLKPGGKLLFVTCSIFGAEGERVAAGFCGAHPTAERLALRWRWPEGGAEAAIGQLLPGLGEIPDHDGFFFASLRKRP